MIEFIVITILLNIDNIDDNDLLNIDNIDNNELIKQ
jgi:hypothetical protein